MFLVLHATLLAWHSQNGSVSVQAIREEVQRLGYEVWDAEPSPPLRISKGGREAFIECQPAADGKVHIARIVAGFHLSSAVERRRIHQLRTVYSGKLLLEFQLGGYVTASTSLLGQKRTISEIAGNLQTGMENLTMLQKDLQAYSPRASHELNGVGRARIDMTYVMDGVIFPDIDALTRACGWKPAPADTPMREWIDAAEIHGIRLNFLGGMSSQKLPVESFKLVWLERADPRTVEGWERELKRVPETDIYVVDGTIWAGHVVSLKGGKMVCEVKKEVEAFALQIKRAKG